MIVCELFAQRILGLDKDSEKMHFEILVRIKNIKGEYIFLIFHARLRAL
ncbi:hypothetical protein O9929_00200 [Vibrio lentus]|nr:hypothetical protein [Vibrio lentus]